MPTWEFSLVVTGVAVDDPAHDARLAAAGAADAMLFEVGGTTTVAFYRDAPTPHHALWSAVRALEDAYPTATVEALDRDLVATSEIAARSGLSRETIRKYVEGERGPGDFPHPLGVVGKGQRVWAWADVHVWLARHGYPYDVDALPIPTEAAIEFDYQLLRHNAAQSGAASMSLVREQGASPWGPPGSTGLRGSSSTT